MATVLSGQIDLSSAREDVALASNTDVASFTVNNSTDTASSFTATIDWGDGLTTPGTVVGSNGSFTVDGGHTYADEGFPEATVTITRTADNTQIAPTGTIAVADTDNLTGHGATITFTPNQPLTNVTVATFNDTNTVNGASDFLASIDWGDGTTTTGTIGGSNGSFSVSGSHTYTAAGDNTITVFMNDDEPDSAFAFATSTAVSGFAGQIDLTSATEGTALTGVEVASFADTSGSHVASDYTATINWGDGTTTPGTISGSGQSFSVTGNHTYADEGDDVLRVTITRTADHTTVTPTATIAVLEGDSLTATPKTISGQPGVALNNVVVATFADTYTGNVASDFIATIDWGDGTATAGTVSGSAGSFSVSGSHTYAAAGQDTISVTLSDDDPGTATATALSTAFIGFSGGDVLLTDATERLALPGNTEVATFSDSNFSDTASSFLATIDWGDGTTTTGTVSGASGSFTVSGGHTYADEASAPLKTTVTRIADSAVAVVSGNIDVAENDVLAAQGATLTGTHGQALSNVTVATFTDADTTALANDFTATVNWGDGTTSAGAVSGSNGSFTVSGTHTYVAAGQDSLQVHVADDAPGTATADAIGTATIGGPNSPPVFAHFGATHTSATEQTPTLLNSAATIADAELDAFNGGAGDYKGASLIIGRTVAPNPQDAFGFGSSGAAFTVDSVNHVLRAGGQEFATYLIPSSGALAGTIAVNFNSLNTIATTALVNNVLEHIGYQNLSDTPPASVTMHYTFNDGNAGAQGSGGNGSDTANRVVDITPVNDAPVVSGVVTLPQIAESSGAHLITQAQLLANASDVDGPSLTAINLAIASGLGTLLDNHNGTWSYTPADTDTTGVSFSYQVTDGIAAPVADSASLDISQPHWMASSDLGIHPPGSLPSAIGDYVQDGTSDILWLNPATLGVDIWKISNGQWAGSVNITPHPAGYQLAPSGDYNGDSISDALWYNPANGDVDLWKIFNGQWGGSVHVGTHPLGYQPAASGDFNHDGVSDILWYNPTNGDVDIWKISNSGQWAGSSGLGTHPAGWQPAGAGDFNGDGTSDILWFNPTTNDAEIWKISNGQWAGSVDLGSHPAGSTPAGIGDFNGDGTSDVLWFNAATNDAEVWLISNGHWAGSVDLGTHPAGWTPAGVGDFNHDGTSDILWRETSTGHTEFWLLANH